MGRTTTTTITTTATATSTATSTATATATSYTHFEDNPRFMAWSIQTTAATTTSFAILCPASYSYVSSGSYGACCNSDPCIMGTKCVSNTIYKADGKTTDCNIYDEASTCTTVKVFAEYPAGTQASVSNMDCFLASVPLNTVYRRIDALSTTTTTTAASSSRTVAPALVTPALPGTARVETGTPTQTGAPQPVPAESKAWMAGAVIGPVALVLALVIVGIFCFRRFVARRRDAAGYTAGRPQETWGSPFAKYNVPEHHDSVLSPESQGSPAPRERAEGRAELA
ncbi:hypothetical protein NOR_08565 [Metarhizium rileyi]|uniref:Uncharacterized protein n=1 Tax=Metarhizium rileyi (strain RCEF 4871) TaxID=1649241 RepID=A0A166W2L1_METRR|nr:hypothetical protein NOR_08565 [Metarhizium rileyi RCEF 4871]